MAVPLLAFILGMFSPAIADDRYTAADRQTIETVIRMAQSGKSVREQLLHLTRFTPRATEEQFRRMVAAGVGEKALLFVAESSGIEYGKSEPPVPKEGVKVTRYADQASSCAMWHWYSDLERKWEAAEVAERAKRPYPPPKGEFESVGDFEARVAAYKASMAEAKRPFIEESASQQFVVLIDAHLYAYDQEAGCFGSANARLVLDRDCKLRPPTLAGTWSGDGTVRSFEVNDRGERIIEARSWEICLPVNDAQTLRAQESSVKLELTVSRSLGEGWSYYARFIKDNAGTPLLVAPVVPRSN